MSGYEIVKIRRVNGRREARWGGEGVWQVIDEGTGLPVVGEGQFWRVSPPAKNSDFMKVELRQRRPPQKKKTWWGKLMLVDYDSTVVGSSVVNVASRDFTVDSVLESALYILRNVDEDVSKDALLQKLVGDYPPKSLKEVSGGDL